MNFKIYKFDCVNSTNDKAIEYIKKGIKYGYIDSNNQLKGRGTFGKKWTSIEGNLFGSIFFPLKKNLPEFHEFTFINPVIILSALEIFCKKLKLFIKWPNDIILNKKKICGILQEVIKSKQKSYLITGFGINLVANPKINNIKSGNIYEETKIKIAKQKLIKEILNLYEDFFYRINEYDFSYYKNKANLLSIKQKIK